MPTSSNARATDPSMLGQTRYPRAPLDHYPTPARCTNSFVKAIEDGLPDLGLEDLIAWEPACGNGAISKVLAPHINHPILNTDIHAYEGQDPAALIDFLKIDAPGGPTMADVVKINDNVVPNAIITNPPYGDEAEAFVRQALRLMEPEHGVVAVLCRHEWDCAKGRRDIFRDHPAFFAKITLLYRPVWIEKKPGEKSASPRFSYAWFVWDWSKDPKVPAHQLYAE